MVQSLTQRPWRSARLLLLGALVCACGMRCDRPQHQSPPPAAAADFPDAGAADPATPPPHVGRFSFLALGDSYTIGQSVAPTDRWPMQLARRLRQRGLDVGDPKIIARTGWTSDDLLQALNLSHLSPNFGLVTLLIGVNNQFRGRDQEEYRQQFVDLLHQSVTLAGGDPGHVLVLSIPDWGMTPYGANFDTKRISSEIDQFNTINRKLSRDVGVGYVDVTGESRQVPAHPELVADDGLHPSGQQYSQWADLALSAAAAALEPAPTTQGAR